MHFTHPAFLFALFALLIPIIIHLFNFRRYQTYFFSNNSFIQNLKQQTQKTSQLKKWIILALRLLALACLILVFAKPYINRKNNAIATQNNLVYIYIDNSFSMENKSKDGNLFHEAKKQAQAIAATFDENTQFVLLTNDLLAKYQNPFSKQDFTKEVETIELSPTFCSLDKIYNYCLQGKHAVKKGKNLYLISDFQKSSTTLSNIKPDSSIQVYLIPLAANKVKNISIDSAWLLTNEIMSNEPVAMHVSISNHSDESIESVPLKLILNGQQKSISSLNIQPESHIETVLNFTTDNKKIQKGYLSITDYPISFDDKLYYTLTTNDVKNILYVFHSKENKYIKMLFESDSSIHFTSCETKSINYQLLPEQDLIIIELNKHITDGLSQELSQYLNEGGNLLLLSPDESNYNNQLNTYLGLPQIEKLDTSLTKIDKINLEHQLYRNVFEQYPENIDLPVVQKHYKLQKTIGHNKQVLISLENNDEFLICQQVGKGYTYLLTVPLDNQFSRFPEHAIFVPTMLNMAAKNTNQSLYYVIGSNDIIEINSSLNPSILQIQSEDKKETFIPEMLSKTNNIRFLTHNQILHDGIYQVTTGSEPVSSIAFNYNRRESDMDFYNYKELDDLIKDYQLSHFTLLNLQHKSMASIKEKISNNGIQLYPLFLILCLLFLLTESVLLRLFFKQN